MKIGMKKENDFVRNLAELCNEFKAKTEQNSISKNGQRKHRQYLMMISPEVELSVADNLFGKFALIFSLERIFVLFWVLHSRFKLDTTVFEFFPKCAYLSPIILILND